MLVGVGWQREALAGCGARRLRRDEGHATAEARPDHGALFTAEQGAWCALGVGRGEGRTTAEARVPTVGAPVQGVCACVRGAVQRA